VCAFLTVVILQGTKKTSKQQKKIKLPAINWKSGSDIILYVLTGSTEYMSVISSAIRH